jgi:hypothetical protein
MTQMLELTRRTFLVGTAITIMDPTSAQELGGATASSRLATISIWPFTKGSRSGAILWCAAA